MNDMLNSLEGFDSGSNYKFGDKMERNRNPRSLFDLSHLNSMTIDNAGLLIPIALWETLPTDDFDINVDCLLRVMPQVVPLYSRQRLYIYGFYSRYSDLWQNWQVFMDKGYTGNVQKTIPVLHCDEDSSETSSSNVCLFNSSSNYVTPNSLLDYIGLPINSNLGDLFLTDDGATSARISALPLMMYLRIYRDYFMNKNEWIEDRVILPDDDSRFRLGDDGRLLSAVDQGKKFYLYYNDGSGVEKDDLIKDGNIYHMGLLYHDYPDDYFTSALPFTQRGSTPTLSSSASKLTGNIPLDFSASIANFTNNHTFDYENYVGLASVGETADNNAGLASVLFTQYGDTYVNAVGQSGANNAFLQHLNKGIAKANNTSISLGLGITLEDIRKLAIEQVELEQLARTDGSYRQFGLSFFGEISKAAYDYRPTYIGGTYKNIAFTEVLQQSGSTVPTTASSGNSPLGAYAGHGITGITEGRIGHIHCDDYGMIMLIACIMPDVYYSQGLDRIFTDSLQSEKWMPERVKLGMQPIYNKEIYYAGNNGASSGDDNYLWAYQNPFDYLRYMPNKIHGKIADSSNKTFYPYTQSRKFNSLPNWGRNFSEAKDVRKDYLFAPSESAYSAQFNIGIRAVRPLPYKAIPAQII